MIARLFQRLLPRLSALLSLPGEISALRQQIWVLDQRAIEANDLQREMIETLAFAPPKTPETDPDTMPDLPSPLMGSPQLAPPPLRDPHRIRTDKDVHYTSQSLPRASGVLHGDGRTR